MPTSSTTDDHACRTHRSSLVGLIKILANALDTHAEHAMSVQVVWDCTTFKREAVMPGLKQNYSGDSSAMSDILPLEWKPLAKPSRSGVLSAIGRAAGASVVVGKTIYLLGGRYK